ncbi:MAG: hypothetical protein AAFY53_03270 [Pseudomonadota bacterium]
MSRRKHNRTRMETAAVEARQADTWIGPLALCERLDGLFPEGVPERAEQRVLASDRMCRRLSRSRIQLFNLFLERPELARWLSSPDALDRMPALFGARKHGAKLKSFIKAADVAAIVDRIGREAYEVALEQTGDLIMLDREPDAVLEDIDVDGRTDARGYLARVTQGLDIDLADLVAGPGDLPDHSADDERGLTRLLERVQP